MAGIKVKAKPNLIAIFNEEIAPFNFYRYSIKAKNVTWF